MAIALRIKHERVIHIQLERTPEESKFAHHKRLVYGKLVDKTLADIDYTELSKYVYGKELSSDVARREMYGSRYTLHLLEEEGIDAVDDTDILNDIDTKMIELRKERQKFFDYRNAFNKAVRDRSRQEELNDIIINAIHNGEVPQLDYIPTEIEVSDNDLLVSLNDLHFGAQFSNYWCTYNSEICRQMLCKYLDEIIKIGKMHGSENCIVWENGDAISGNIHTSIQVTNKENVIEQITGVSELIAEFLAELSKHFKTVSFASVSGNHSRITPNKNDALVDERLDDLIEWYLKARLQNFDNIIIEGCERIDPTMYLLNIRGQNYLGCHGDFDGSASKIQSLQSMVDKPLYAVLLGHLHHNKIDAVQGIKTVMAGSFLGVDSYCVQKRIFGRPEQMICVCDNNGIRCSYDIPLKIA